MKSIFTIFILTAMFLTLPFTVSFAQINWTKDTLNNPVFGPGPTSDWDGYSIYPSSILFDGTKYHIWYGGHDSVYCRIGYAISNDGITWTKYDDPATTNPPFSQSDTVMDVGAAGSWDSRWIFAPKVHYDGNTYHMWYSGFNGTNVRIGYATSPNGTTWTKYSGNPVFNLGTSGSWDDSHISSPSIIYDGGIYHMWYEGGKGSTVQIGYATSTDGITWTRHPQNPVLKIGHSGSWGRPMLRAPEVIFYGGIYHMWYSGTPSLWNHKIGYATSPYGIVWTKYNDPSTTITLYSESDPVLLPGPKGSWDDQFVVSGTAIYDSINSKLKLYYGGGDTDGKAQIGYATATNLILFVPGQYSTIQEGINAADSGDVVLVDEGTYYENINFKGKAITVTSQYWFDGDTSHISNTIIDGSQPNHLDSGSVVYFMSGEDTTSVLCGFTITGGSGSYNPHYDMYGGGGISMTGGKIINNRIIKNSLSSSQKGGIGAGLGGDFQSPSCNAVIEYNEFKDNSINAYLFAGGGAIYCKWTSDSGYIQIKNNLISGNSVTCTKSWKAYGGGIGLAFDLPTSVDAAIENNIITKNELHCAASIGAGIYVVYWEPGGEISDNFPCPVISNNIIANNYSEDKGAGIGIWTAEDNHNPNSIIAPQPAIINNTIVNNKANDGCGIFNFDSYPLLMNNILWNDLSVEGSREIFNNDLDYPQASDKINGGELFIYYSDIQGGWEGEGNIDVDPTFVDTDNGNYRLTETSKCVGTGTDSSLIQDYWYHCPSYDFYHHNRPNPIDKYVDIGAIESPYVRDPEGISSGINIYPEIFNLSQNHPNPFNSNTVISWQVGVTGRSPVQIDLSIYNILGQKVATLVSGKQKAGFHSVEWDASEFSSGVYYYQLLAGDPSASSGQVYREVKKMILLK
jgi:predicted GH43/DUF377 family glycosyl hydrolase